jgi:hypothetical protein
MDKTESTVRNMLTAIEAPLYDVGVLSDRGMLPGLDGIPAAAVLDRLSLLKYRNAHSSHICTRLESRSARLGDCRALFLPNGDRGYRICLLNDSAPPPNIKTDPPPQT